MAFQPPVTVSDVLSGIHHKRYLLPAIQREFVWTPDQIRRLMDSLMRGYPIGSFLLWEVESTTANAYTFYDFLTDYHERDNPYASKATVPAGQGTTAVLDGQQRLTALNIAIYGTHAEKRKWAWWNSADAFPRKRLYLNLAENPDDEELGSRFDLRFLTDPEAKPEPGEPDKWFPVGKVLELQNSGPAMHREITQRDLLSNPDAFDRLYELYEALRVRQPINYYVIKDQDPDRVLEIFVRVNSGGTALSSSDLLLSMATNQWQQLDAREEVRSLVQELNTAGTRQFAFSKDLVLKTALMIAGTDLRFRVSNFTAANMARVETAWPDIETSLIRAATLLHQFGYSQRTLTADSVIIPIAYYLYRRSLTDSYLDSSRDAPDRAAVRSWVTRTLIKRGVWGSGLDTLLTRIRDVLAANTSAGFPAAALESAMATVGKGLVFDETEVDELLKLKYGGQRTFPVLALLYPGLDFSKAFHEDHVFPKSLFTRSRLSTAGIPEGQIDRFIERVNLLPNLQLLEGVVNTEKLAKLPGEWLQTAFDNPARRDNYIETNDLDGLPLKLTAFDDYFDERSERMRSKLIKALSPSPTEPTAAP